MTAASGPLSKVSNCIASLANNANFLCCIHLSHERGCMMVRLSQKTSIWRRILRQSAADCAMLYSMTVILADLITIVDLPSELTIAERLLSLGCAE